MIPRYFRVLIEAIRPYRVVHANAAFSKSVIGTSNNIQRWIDQQNSQRKSKAYRTLEKALRDMVPDLDVPLTVYPVLGSETISHYLVETIYSNPKKRRRGKLEEPSRTIG